MAWVDVKKRYMVSLMNKPIIEVGTQMSVNNMIHIITILRGTTWFHLTYLSTSRRKGSQDYVSSIPKLQLGSKRFQSTTTNTKIEEMERILKEYHCTVKRFAEIEWYVLCTWCYSYVHTYIPSFIKKFGTYNTKAIEPELQSRHYLRMFNDGFNADVIRGVGIFNFQPIRKFDKVRVGEKCVESVREVLIPRGIDLGFQRLSNGFKFFRLMDFDVDKIANVFQPLAYVWSLNDFHCGQMSEFLKRNVVGVAILGGPIPSSHGRSTHHTWWLTF